MKKEYIQPQTETLTIRNSNILSGSVSAGDGYTSEQNAKKMDFDFYYEEDEY